MERMDMANRGKLAGSPDGPVRQRLLDGAMDLFTQKGYASTTVREIVAAAGVSKPVLYYYFRNKEGIYLELMKDAFGRVDDLLTSSTAERGSAKQRLLRLCDQTYSLFRERVKVARIMYAIYYGPHQGAPFFDFDAYHVKFMRTIQRLIEEGIRNREFRKGNPEEMAWAVIGAINVAMEVHLGGTELQLGREGLARVLQLIFRGISGRKGRQR